MTPSELTSLWEAVARPPGGRLNGRRIGSLPAPAAWAAVDSAGTWHLLVEVSERTPALTETPTRGLTVVTDRMRVGDEVAATYVDLGCPDSAFRDAFAALGADLVQRLGGGDPASNVVATTLLRWRRFWTVPRVGLTEEQALGLFGELWFLERWIGLPLGVRRWSGPNGSRHDFQWPEASVEVKATRVGDGAAVHSIGSLGQLEDPESGRLYLFSLHVSKDSLAANTLPGLVARIEAALESVPDAQVLLRERLAAVGYSPVHAQRYDQPWRLLAEELYRVEGDFPRLTRSSFRPGLPAGIQEVSYHLDLAACAAWRIASRPSDADLAFLRD